MAVIIVLGICRSEVEKTQWPIMLAFQKVLLIVIELILLHLFLIPQTVGQLGEEYYSYPVFLAINSKGIFLC